MNDNAPATRATPGSFPATRWSLILEAKGANPDALAILCRDYWFPLYCYARTLRRNAEDAKDLTQGFFVHILSKEGFQKADHARGKLRSFLMGSLRNFANDDWKHAGRAKRGGGEIPVSIDAPSAERRFAREPCDTLTPEVAFDRAWARQLLDDVLEKLAAAYREAGKEAVFEKLRDHLVPGAETRPYAELAPALGMSEAALRLAAFKLRNRYRELLKQTVAATVTSESEVMEELAHLRTAFAD